VTARSLLPDSEGTAENAEIAEINLLCGLCELGGFFSPYY
jgi:hypothetical protein